MAQRCNPTLRLLPTGRQIVIGRRQIRIEVIARLGRRICRHRRADALIIATGAINHC